MKALFFDGKRLALKENLSKPIPKKGEALIKVSACGICATDLEITRGYMGFQGVPGHEFSGMVVSPKTSRYFGKRVTGEINLFCNKCEYCKQGLGNHCPNRTVLGIYNKHGAFAEYLTLPEKNLYPLPSTISDEEAIFIEPLAAAFEIIKQGAVKKVQDVCVLGDGRLGLLVALALKLSKANVTAIGKHADKLKILKNKDIKTLLLNKLPKTKFDVVVDCTGSAEGLTQALSLVRPRGTLVVKSTVAGSRTPDLNKIVIDEITLLGSRCGPFKPAIAALKNKKINVKRLIDATYSLDEGIKAFKHAAKKGVLKVIVKTHEERKK